MWVFLQWAGGAGLDVRVLSDCNSVFIGHMLTGARVSSIVSEVITNFASFQRVAGIQVRCLQMRLLPRLAACRSGTRLNAVCVAGCGKSHSLLKLMLGIYNAGGRRPGGNVAAGGCYGGRQPQASHRAACGANLQP